MSALAAQVSAVIPCKDEADRIAATVRAVAAYPGGVSQLIRDYCDERMRYLRSLKSSKTGFPVNGRGWTIRAPRRCRFRPMRCWTNWACTTIRC